MAEYPENTKQDMILPKIINRTLPLHAGGCIQQVPVLLPKFLEICTILLLTKAILPLKCFLKKQMLERFQKALRTLLCALAPACLPKKLTLTGRKAYPDMPQTETMLT